ncbi:MAG: response regulator [Gammaproteobacteria bacterium]
MPFDRVDDTGAAGLGRLEAVAVVCAEPALAEAVVAALDRLGIGAERFAGVEAFLAQRPETLDCVVVDVDMQARGAPDLIADLVRRAHAVPVVVIAPPAGIASAVRAMRAGAADYLERPVAPNVVADRVAAQIRHGRPRH